jgi:hypothetical protein
MTVEAKAFVSILLHGHAGNLIEHFPGLTTANAFKTSFPLQIRLRADLHSLQTGTAREAAKALWVEAFLRASQGNEPALNRKAALMASRGWPSYASWSRRPMTTRHLNS